MNSKKWASGEPPEIIVYDNAGWHYGGDFPKELAVEAGGTHIGMFLAWMWINGLQSKFVDVEQRNELAAIRNRKKTGPDVLMNDLDEKLHSGDFSEEGNAFIKAYYTHPKKSYGQYLVDYSEVFDGPDPSLYHVADSWENYDRLAAVVDRRYRDWKRKRRKLGKPRR